MAIVDNAVRASKRFTVVSWQRKAPYEQPMGHQNLRELVPAFVVVCHDIDKDTLGRSADGEAFSVDWPLLLLSLPLDIFAVSAQFKGGCPTCMDFACFINIEFQSNNSTLFGLSFFVLDKIQHTPTGISKILYANNSRYFPLARFYARKPVRDPPLRTNLPVTQREFDYPSDATLMSTTDTRSYVQYANPAFLHVAGLSHGEIVGQAHNIVRHPDMPPAAFADLWATVKAGHSWTGFVKNRRSDGDHYWVRANVTPVIRDGQLKGYMSVRIKPTPAEISSAEKLYKDMREVSSQGLRLHHGLLLRTGLMAWTNVFKLASTATRIRVGVAIAPLAILAAIWSASSSWPC